MRVHEHFDAVAVLDNGTCEVHSLSARLNQAGFAPVVVDLCAAQGWRPPLAALHAEPRPAQPTRVLLLSPASGVDHEF